MYALSRFTMNDEDNTIAVLRPSLMCSTRRLGKAWGVERESGLGDRYEQCLC